jgi:hypothetical protein
MKIKSIHHKSLIETIENFRKSQSAKIFSKDRTINELIAEYKYINNKIEIDFQYSFLSKKSKCIGDYFSNVQIQLGNAVYCLEDTYFGKYAPPIATCTVSKVHSIGFSKNKKYYYRLIIPLKEELQFHFQIEETPFSTDLGYFSRTGTTAIVKGDTFQICCFHNRKKEYFLSIESNSKQTYDEFADKAYAVKIALGYLSGYFVGNCGYFFAYTNKSMIHPKHFRFQTLRSSIKSSYYPVYSNPHGYLPHNRELAKKYLPIIRVVSIKEFSNLSEKIYDSVDFASVLLLILESSIASLLFMPGGFAIALESLSDLVIGKRKLKLAPIKDKNTFNEIRKEISNLLKTYDSIITKEELEILHKKIDQLNQVPNMARLKAPFDILNISLNNDDLKILKSRNDFLHGRVPDPTKSGNHRSLDRINNDLYYCSMKFYTLLNLIIMKWIGYDNRIINYPKIHEDFTGVFLDEEPFRQV